MAVQSPIKSSLLTYEEYMAEDEVNLRYDILDGERTFMSAPTWRHQKIQKNLMKGFMAYEDRPPLKGHVVPPPFDLLIRRNPLRTRQPDVLYISEARLQEAGVPPERGPLEAGPEIVVEIISASDRRRMLESKLRDYISIGVEECWIVWPDSETVEVRQRTESGFLTLQTYGRGETVISSTLPDIRIPVDAIFAA